VEVANNKIVIRALVNWETVCHTIRLAALAFICFKEHALLVGHNTYYTIGKI